MTRLADIFHDDVDYAEAIAGLKPDDLRALTNEMIDHQLALIADATDADVVFVPVDPDADDPHAATEGETNMAWTLAHVIVHTTASSEESAALAAELARGVKYHGRSRHEVYWETVTTVVQCRARLEESRRMRLASLDMWPDVPHYDNTYKAYGTTVMNCTRRFMGGLGHDHSHLGQLVEIMRQAKAARGVK